MIRLEHIIDEVKERYAGPNGEHMHKYYEKHTYTLYIFRVRIMTKTIQAKARFV